MRDTVLNLGFSSSAMYLRLGAEEASTPETPMSADKKKKKKKSPSKVCSLSSQRTRKGAAEVQWSQFSFLQVRRESRVEPEVTGTAYLNRFCEDLMSFIGQCPGQLAPKLATCNWFCYNTVGWQLWLKQRER